MNLDILKTITKSNTNTDNELTDDIIIDSIVKFDSLIINQLRTVSYDTYTQAISQIKDKYTSIEEYRLNIKKDFTNIPIDPDIIYRRTGWKGWNIYLNSNDEQLEKKYKIRQIFSKIDLYGPIDIYAYIDDSLEINIYKLLNYKFTPLKI